jgi:hypothetical protein
MKMFFHKRGPNLLDFEEKNSKLQNFYEGSQEYSSLFPLVSYIICSQIYLNHVVDDCHFN